MFALYKLSILIPSTRVEGEGRSAFTIYDIFVSALHRDEHEPSIWTVSHRYSSFLKLHLQVSKKFPKQYLFLTNLYLTNQLTLLLYEEEKVLWNNIEIVPTLKC